LLDKATASAGFPKRTRSKLLEAETRAAALLEREELLTAEARYLPEESYRRHAEINEELAEIHRLLEALGLRSKDQA
jgi:hypothetical protein